MKRTWLVLTELAALPGSTTGMIVSIRRGNAAAAAIFALLGRTTFDILIY